MPNTLLTTGLLCVIAAIVGGGVEALGGRVPVIQSPKRQTALALFGIVLLVAAYLSSTPNAPTAKSGPSSDSKLGRAPEEVNNPAPSRTVAPPKSTSDDILGGTSWVGVFVGPTQLYPDNAKEANITLLGQGDAAIEYFQGILWVTRDSCKWFSPQTGVIRIDCYPQTVPARAWWPNKTLRSSDARAYGRLPQDVELHRETFSLTITGSSMRGTRTVDDEMDVGTNAPLRFDVALKRLDSKSDGVEK